MTDLNLSIDDMEDFRDNFNQDDAVIERRAPRFYHYTKDGNDVVFDSQALGRDPYTVVAGLNFEAFLIDNEILVVGSRALLKGIKVNRVEADPVGVGRIVEWLDEQTDKATFSQKLRR